MINKRKQTSAGSTLLKWLFAAAFVAAVAVSGLFSGLEHGVGLYYLLLGSIAAVFMGFSGREIVTAVRAAAGRPGSAGELGRAAYFWEAAARNAWILGVLGSALNFIIVLGRGIGGIGDIATQIIHAFIVTLYGLVTAVVYLVPAIRLRSRIEHAQAPGPLEASERAVPVSGRTPVIGRILGYIPFLAVLATAGYSLISRNPQSGSLSMANVLLHWPSLLIVVGGTIALAIFTGAGAGAQALTVGFAMTGLISLLMGLIQTFFGFAHHNIHEVTSALVFIISSCSFALFGMLAVAAPLEDRDVMEGRRERPGYLSRMFWVVFPLVAFIFLVLSLILIVTPIEKTVGG